MPRRRNKDGPKTSDKRLWEEVKKTAKPLKADREIAPVMEDIVPSETPALAPPTLPKKTDRSPQTPGALMPGELSRRERRSLRQGRTSLDQTLDLHGMTQAQAHDFLAIALRDAQAADCRRLLVITGKGGGLGTTGAGTRGVLRTRVPVWLKEGPLSHYVSRLASAHARHGGEGAFYVFLKRRKVLRK